MVRRTGKSTKRIELEANQYCKIIEKFNNRVPLRDIPGARGITERRMKEIKKNTLKYQNLVSSGAKKTIRISKPRNSALEIVASELLDTIIKLGCYSTYEFFKYQLAETLKDHPEIEPGGLTFRWYKGFLNRRNLVVRKTCGKAKGDDGMTASKYSKEFAHSVRSANVKPNHIFNADETRFLHIPPVLKSVVKKGDRDASAEFESKVKFDGVGHCVG